MMKPIDLLQALYGDRASDVESKVTQLLDLYRGVGPQASRLTENDAIMITYGDGFFDDRGNPLDCLRRFASEQIGNAISAVHLLPCFPYTSDDGFSVQDYYRVNPDLGDWNDIDALGNDYELMFDAVVNHISKSSDWFQGFLSGDPEYADWFLVSDPDDDYSSVTRPRALPLLHPFERVGETIHVWTTFSEDQIDLNFHSAGVFVKVLDVLLFYVSKGARYIRLDAIAFIWKQLGTSCMHLPQAHKIIQLYRHFIDQVAPGVVIITETNVPHEENISYFGDGTNEAHMVYNFTLPPLVMHSLHKQSVCELTRWAKTLTLPSDQVCFFNFTASHDGVGVRPLQGIVSDQAVEELAAIARTHGGFVSMRDNGDGTQSPYEINCNYFDFATDPNEPDDLRIDRFLLTQSVMLTMPGVPGIYYHSLIGSENDRESAIESGINRRINRAKIDYTRLKSQLADPDSLRSRIFTRYKRMLETRGGLPAMNPFADAAYDCRGPVFVIKRTSGDQFLLALHNFSDRSQSVDDLPEGLVDVFTNEPLPDRQCELAPFEFRWLR